MALRRERRGYDAARATLVVVGVVLLLVGLLVRPISRRYIFRGATRDVTPVVETPLSSDVSECMTTAKDGVPVHMLLLSSPSPDVVVLFHNNRETAEQQEGLARSLARYGDLSVLIVEYRGYGRSSGVSPTEDGLYFDAEAALEYLQVDRNVRPGRVVLMGTSLGSGVAAEMAARGRGSRLVLVTPYTSIPDLVNDVVPLVPAAALLGDHFDTLAKAPAIRVPTLIVHGDADEIVPFAMGERLARTIAETEFFPIAGGHHGDLFLRGGDGLVDEIITFIRRGSKAT